MWQGFRTHRCVKIAGLTLFDLAFGMDRSFVNVVTEWWTDAFAVISFADVKCVLLA